MIVDVSNLKKKFGKVQVLNGLSMQVENGEIYGFIGPNGAGKSTTIKILLGILKATEGEAKIFGKDVWRDAVDIHKHLAYVPGDVNLWPNLTGGEVIDLFMRLRGEKNNRKRDEYIEKFQLDPSKKCRTYSKGNRQKVALVAAFASNAKLFILDEPTSGLDPLMERVFQEAVLQVKDEGRSVLLSSHILSEVETLCDKIGIIRHGEIIETGTLNELRHLTRTNLLVATKQPIQLLTELEGVHHIERKGDHTISMQVDSQYLDELMKYISQFGILKLESSPPTLEDLFMRHYETSKGGN